MIRLLSCHVLYTEQLALPQNHQHTCLPFHQLGIKMQLFGLDTVQVNNMALVLAKKEILGSDAFNNSHTCMTFVFFS